MAPRAFRDLRKRLGLTQAAAAELVEVTSNTWARWERGQARPRGLHQREAIASLPSLTRRRQHPFDPDNGRKQKTHRPSAPRVSTGRDLLKFVGTWAGDDAEECLKLVYAMRGKARF